MAIIRVGELREFIEHIPGDVEIRIWSEDNGTDWGQRLGERHEFAEAGARIGCHSTTCALADECDQA